MIYPTRQKTLEQPQKGCTGIVELNKGIVETVKDILHQLDRMDDRCNEIYGELEKYEKKRYADNLH